MIVLIYFICRINEDGRWTVVWRNKHIDNCLNPVWEPVKIPLALLCNGDLDRPLKIEIFDYEKSGKHVFMGHVETNVRQLIEANGSPMNIIEPSKAAKKKSYVNSGTFIAANAVIEKNPTFSDFIAGGCEVCFMVAIDFTKSNGDPSLPTSLHYTNPDPEGGYYMNAYEEVITSIGSILQNYDTDKMFPVFGFGGKIRLPDGTLTPAQHCFPVYGGGLEVHGIEGILQAYRDAKGHVELSGPTLFAPLIRSAMQLTAQYSCW